MNVNVIEKCSALFDNGLRVVNATPYAITFLGADDAVITVASAPELVLNARMVERPVAEHLVTTVPTGTEDGEALIAEIKAVYPDALIVGSMIAAQAYRGQVVAMTPAPGYERVAPAEKRMSTEKFTIFVD